MNPRFKLSSLVTLYLQKVAAEMKKQAGDNSKGILSLDVE
jgi:hypothetical protein